MRFSALVGALGVKSSLTFRCVLRWGVPPPKGQREEPASPSESPNALDCTTPVGRSDCATPDTTFYRHRGRSARSTTPSTCQRTRNIELATLLPSVLHCRRALSRVSQTPRLRLYLCASLALPLGLSPRSPTLNPYDLYLTRVCARHSGRNEEPGVRPYFLPASPNARMARICARVKCFRKVGSSSLLSPYGRPLPSVFCSLSQSPRLSAR